MCSLLHQLRSAMTINCSIPSQVLFPTTKILPSARPTSQLHLNIMMEKKLNKPYHGVSHHPSNKFHSSTFVKKIFGTFNPFKAFDTWYDLEKLKNDWDPGFNLADFKYGAARALCTVVNLIQQNCWLQLRGLVTRPLVERLEQDHEILRKINVTKELLLENVISTSVNRVAIQEIVDRRYCDIDVVFRIKGTSIHNDKTEEAFMTYILRFHREYTRGKLPEWTITKINIADEVLPS